MSTLWRVVFLLAAVNAVHADPPPLFRLHRPPAPLGADGPMAIDSRAAQRLRQALFFTPGFQPSGLAYDGEALYVTELSGFRRIHRLDPVSGESLGSFLAPSPSGLDGRGNPNGLTSDGRSSLFVTDIGDFGAGVVYEVDVEETTILGSFTLPFRGGGIAFDGRDLYVSDFDSGTVRVMDRFGELIRTFDSGLRPAGLTFDPSAGTLWAIDEFNERLTELTFDGTVVRSCDGPRQPGIQGLGGVTAVRGRLYIAEVLDPDPFRPPEIPGLVFGVDPAELSCRHP